MDIDELRELGLNDSEGSDDDDLTAAQILQSMENIWLNEKFAPEILPHKMEVVECLYLQIEEMEKNVERLQHTDVRRAAHELELKRIRFLLSSYLRIRLLKIESYAHDIKEQEDIRRNNHVESYLSNSETVFLESYKNILDRYMADICNFSSGYVQDDTKENPIKPNLNSFVFLLSKNTVNGVLIDANNIHDDVVDIKTGSKMIMPYKSVKNLLMNEDIQLI